MVPDARRRRHDRLGSLLARLSNGEISAVLERAQPLGTSIGGMTRRCMIQGVPVFVKGIRLTDLEATRALSGATGNVFGLPVACHYGIGSPGFGVWRELAAHQQTTELVLNGDYPSFPLMYHWRVLPSEPAPLVEELSDVEAAVRYWDGSDAVRERLTALRAASQVVWVFLELVDDTLHTWLTDQLRHGPAALIAACDFVEAELHAGADAMATAGLLHLDLHFDNILTDGSRLYFADLGLMLSDRFDLDPAERLFASEHRDYDRSYAFTWLVRWVNRNLADHQVPTQVAQLINRYTPVAEALMPFYLELQNTSRQARYPRVEEQQAWSTARGT